MTMGLNVTLLTVVAFGSSSPLVGAGHGPDFYRKKRRDLYKIR